MIKLFRRFRKKPVVVDKEFISAFNDKLNERDRDRQMPEVDLYTSWCLRHEFNTEALRFLSANSLTSELDDLLSKVKL